MLMEQDHCWDGSTSDNCKFIGNMLTHWRQDKMDEILQMTFSNAFSLNENVWIAIKISLRFVPKGSIIIIPALVQIMAWCPPGNKPLSKPMMT